MAKNPWLIAENMVMIPALREAGQGAGPPIKPLAQAAQSGGMFSRELKQVDSDENDSSMGMLSMELLDAMYSLAREMDKLPKGDMRLDKALRGWREIVKNVEAYAQDQRGE